MDTRIARAIIDLQVPQFGPSEKNKGDSCSCRFEPRHLLSSPEVLEYIGRALGEVARDRCSGTALVGMATSGIAWATLASVHSRLPLLYLRKQAERLVSNKLLEGIRPADGRVILVDDLLFAGESKREALRILHDLGLVVTDIIVIIDRQLQRVADGPRLQDEFDLHLHALITMSEIVRYMQQTGAISEDQLAALAADYRARQRWDLPEFAAPGTGSSGWPERR